ncbi:BamA/OMP85 family outer membrane protein [Anabaena subtropica]|uniref:Outer membrane protein assembly factor n=1 Tax=Anabaena subtropica FACHB-260 TaxID=2692884 RepID=A0ABR8CVA5_9NOST|nr:outer membrane protein assembly factor [Anabaena subtropica]MBD2347125.1 outer membrane protein assembly factor [Anabaena subtropica FACHB-260]
MRISSAAILTLTTLAASNATQQAIAAPPTASTQTELTENIVIPAVEETPVQLGGIASPETEVTQQFSNKSTVIAQNAPVVLPSKPRPVVPPAPKPATTVNELVVTATDVQIVGATPELQKIIRQVIQTQTGGDTSQTKLQRDVAAISETGLFASVNVNSRTTPSGLNVVYQVQPVVVRSLQLTNAKALTYSVAQPRFQSQIGKPISPQGLKQAVEKVNKWYADNGYNLARVLSIEPNREGILNINVAEGLVSDIKFRFVNDEGKTVDSNGNPVGGRTKPDFLRQQLKLQPGQVFQENTVKQDVQQLYRTGLFQSVNVAFEGDATKLDMIYELKENGARAINLGGSYNGDVGLMGTLNFQDQNIGGKNDTFAVNVGLSSRDLQFDTKFISPYRDTNSDRLGYTINAFRQREISETFDNDITLANGDRVREGKIGAGISLQQPIDGWNASLGLNYSRTSIRDRQGNITPTDAQGNPLSVSGTGVDDLTTVSFSATKDQRDNPINPTQGSVIRVSTEQSVPIGQGNISMNRLKADYSQYVPVNIFNSQTPQVFALNVQAGTVLGNLPPYETFNLGGSNSVRGYDAGNVGSGRSYVLASAEYRFPIVPIVGGVLFADFASDLGSGDTVLGDPAGVRGKPGSGFGYGAGIRLDSPLGLIRADYGINDQGESRVHLGIGQRF